MSVVILDAGPNGVVQFDGSAAAAGYILRSLTGWLGSTSAKVDLVERSAGDGAHDVVDAQILYSARTVSVEYRLLPYGADDRSTLLAMQTRIRSLLHRQIRVRVVDADHDLTATGYVDSIDVEHGTQNVNRQFLTGQINIVCPRPELCSTDMQLVQLLPLDGANEGEGLRYGDKLETWGEGEPNNSVSVLSITPGDRGLSYPIDYGDAALDGRNRGTLTNHGSSPAYPLITAEGNWPQGIDLQIDGRYTLLYELPVSAGASVALDFRSRTASVNGTDVTRHLTQRGFAPVEPGSSVDVVLRSTGDGFVSVSMADTWM